MSGTDRRFIAKLAEMVARHDDQLKTMSQPQLVYSSIDDGALLEKDIDGKVTTQIGKQYDGTHTVVTFGGPRPPKPTGISGSAIAETLLAMWDGTWEDFVATSADAVDSPGRAPMNFKRLEMHVSEDPELTGLLFETFAGTIETSRGGSVPVHGLVPGTDYYLRAIARSDSGQYGTASDVIGPLQVRRLGVAEIDTDAIGGNMIYKGPNEPEGDQRVGNLWLALVDPGPPELFETRRYEGEDEGWLPVADQKVTDAIQRAFAAQQTADRKTTTITADEEPSHEGRTIGDEWIDSSAGGRRMLWTGESWAWVPIGNDAIEPNSLIAKDVIATGTVTAALFEAIIVLATTIIAGDPTGTHARMTPTGFRVFRPDANGDGIPDEVVRLGTDTDDIIAIVKADGSLAASLDSSGWASVSGLSTTTWPTIGSPDHTGRGGSLLDILDRRPRGLAGYGLTHTNYLSNSTVGRGCFDIPARLYKGRMYEIGVRCRINSVYNDEGGPLAEVWLRWTASALGSRTFTPAPPPSPSMSSEVIGRHFAAVYRPDAEHVTLTKLFSLGEGDNTTYQDVRILLGLTRSVGNYPVTINGAGVDGTELWVKDIGPFIANAATENMAGGSDGSSSTPPAAQAPQVQRFSRTWVGTWHQNWKPNGAFIDLPGASQGHDPVNGNMRSYIGFSGPATDGSGLSMDQALSGAVIEEVGVYLYSNHWWNDTGGDIVLGMHGYRDPAPGFGGGNEWMFGNMHFRKPGGEWFSLGAISPQNWATGVWKGLMLGAGGADDLAHYGRFDTEGSPNAPQINITYRK